MLFFACRVGLISPSNVLLILAFAGALTLSPDAVAALGLPFFQEIDANLANDADVKTAVHIATIVWDGREMEVAVLAMGRRRCSEPRFCRTAACAPTS